MVEEAPPSGITRWRRKKSKKGLKKGSELTIDTYINDEHLKTVSDTVYGKTYNLFYDALGRCVKRDLNSTTTYYIYDGERSARAPRHRRSSPRG